MDMEAIKEAAVAANNVAEVAFQSGYETGYKAGLKAYAWWKDGVQYVGTCGKTLKQALEECKNGN